MASIVGTQDAAAGQPTLGASPAAVLFDRDGTVCVDVPYNGDPARVVPMPTAAAALARLRAVGVATAMVSNQSGIGRGLISLDQVSAVNRRLDELLGGIGPTFVCPHVPDAGCACRKPRPGLLLAAASHLGVPIAACAVIGDIGADVASAAAVGARAVLVPTSATRAAEIAAAAEVAPDVLAAVDLVLTRPRPAPAPGPAAAQPDPDAADSSRFYRFGRRASEAVGG